MKKLLSLALAAAMAAGMSVSAFAATGTVYKEFAGGKSLSSGYKGNADLGDIHPVDQEDPLEIFLYHDMFLDEDGKVGPDSKVLTSKEIRDSKIAVRTQVKSGSKTLAEPVSLNAGKGKIEVQFVDEWVSTKEEDFEIFIYLTINGKRFDAEGITLTGTMLNPEIDVYEDQDYVDLTGGYVAIAEDYVKNIEVDLGEGVSIFTKFFKNKKYYGVASRDPDEDDDVVFSKYPDVDNVITLKTVGLNSTGDIVKLATDHEGYFVYDKDMKYLGKSNEMLPFSAKYYLANTKLDVGDDVDEPEEEEDPEEEEESEPDYTPDSNYGNAMDNPDTGAGGFLSIAIAAAIVSLAAVGITRSRKK